MKRKLTRAQLRRLLLREVQLLNEENSYDALMSKLKSGIKAIKDYKPPKPKRGEDISPGPYGFIGGSDSERGTYVDIIQSLQDIVTNLSTRISMLEEFRTQMLESIEREEHPEGSRKFPKQIYDKGEFPFGDGPSANAPGIGNEKNRY